MPYGFDLTPGINVGAAFRRGLGLNKGKDEDIISGFSKKGGARTTTAPVLGRTYTGATPVLGNMTTWGTGVGGSDASIDQMTQAEVDAMASGLGGAGGQADLDAPLRAALQAEIAARGGDVEAVYQSLFGELDNLVKSRDGELETQYGDQFKKAADTYTGAIPEIETSYAAIGANDSTDNSDAKSKAKAGYEDTTKTIGKNKEADKAKLGQYKNQTSATIKADKDSATSAVSRAGSTTDVGALRTMRNDLETNISQAGVTKASLGSDAGGRKAVSDLTQDAGRFEAASNALDSIIKSSMSGSVKEAAVKAITDNAGLSEDEKQKVQQQYGNVYAEQSAL